MQRFWDKVDLEPNEHGCLLWKASLRTKNAEYGSFWLENKNRSAHVVSYYLHNNKWPAKGYVVGHACEIYYKPKDVTFKRCVNPEHLKEMSHSENSQMAFDNKRFSSNLANYDQRGENNGSAKLTEIEVLEIRRLYATGKYSQRQLGKIFGVSKTTIKEIVNRKKWKHI